jgi:hypothetical protein
MRALTLTQAEKWRMSLAVIESITKREEQALELAARGDY